MSHPLSHQHVFSEYWKVTVAVVPGHNEVHAAVEAERPAEMVAGSVVESEAVG